ncbi:hypothetical protein AB6A40_006016 [Gnathostoma spinigerum]|uniref:Uncharacterized protein n=1 Tax=Gnathostoma spinigerum TaxID=75299 RepID=A0ABD6ERJ5_9BILA
MSGKQKHMNGETSFDSTCNTRPDMMNVVVVSERRNRRWKRQSLALTNSFSGNNVENGSSKRGFDPSFFEPLKPNVEASEKDSVQNALKSLEDYYSRMLQDKGPALSRHISSELNIPSFAIKNLAHTAGITKEDLEMLRKDFIRRLNSCTTHEERLLELHSTIAAMNEIPITSRVSTWLEHCQYILNWAYGRLRFVGDPIERKKLFFGAKEKYRQMFECLKDAPDVEKVASYFHWSHLCYEYAEVADEESLNWCLDYVSHANARLCGSGNSSRSSTLTRGSSSNDSVVEQSDNMREKYRKKRYLELLESIRTNITKTEALQISLRTGGHWEKAVM